MKRALVVIDPSGEAKTLLREAGELAAGVESEIVLLGIRSKSAVESDLKTLEKIGAVEGTTYSEDTLLDALIGEVNEYAEDVLAGVEVESEIVGMLADEGERKSKILSAAESHDCDHIFMTGRKRSPAGKALFGDATQAVLLEFDGAVTLLLE
ncbi:universal stress protein [Haloarchaeobius sp. TZWSO28]|uniref:universal stress protein n=1 Tax=Haloarchaeobius sp. TZWSO28 TaxID=3446119 RepID=UPI003EC1529B